jgi:hypothetical protein
MKQEVIELLQDLRHYMSNRAGEYATGFDPKGTYLFKPNQEMTFEQRIDAVLQSASAQTKAEVYNVMFDTTSNAES